MIHLGLNLDQFEHVRDMVRVSVEEMATEAKRKNSEAIEHQRRSLGQIIRWAEWRLSK